VIRKILAISGKDFCSKELCKLFVIRNTQVYVNSPKQLRMILECAAHKIGSCIRLGFNVEDIVWTHVIPPGNFMRKANLKAIPAGEIVVIDKNRKHQK